MNIDHLTRFHCLTPALAPSGANFARDASGCLVKSVTASLFTYQCAHCSVNAKGLRPHSRDSDTCVGKTSIFAHGELDRSGDDSEISMANAEFPKAVTRSRGSDGKAHLGEEFVVVDVGRHEVFAKIRRPNGSGTALFLDHDLGIQQCRQ